MNKIIAGVISCICFVLFSSLGFSQEEQRIERYFPLYDNNKWIYYANRIQGDKGKSYLESMKIDGHDTVKGIQTSRLMGTSGEYSAIAFTKNGLQIMKYHDLDNEYSFFDPVRVLIPRTLNQTESVLYEIKQVNYHYPEGTYWDTISVHDTIDFLGYEEAVTRAGVFEGCLKLRIHTKWIEEDGDYAIKERTLWFALGVGLVKELDIRHEWNPRHSNHERTFIVLKSLRLAIINGKKIGASLFPVVFFDFLAKLQVDRDWNAWFERLSPLKSG